MRALMITAVAMCIGIVAYAFWVSAFLWLDQEPWWLFSLILAVLALYNLLKRD